MNTKPTKSVVIFKHLLICAFVTLPFVARAYQNPDYFDTNYPASYDSNSYYSNTYPAYNQAVYNQTSLETPNIDFYTSNYVLPSNMGYYAGMSSQINDLTYYNDIYSAAIATNHYHQEIEENLKNYRDKIQETKERIKSYQDKLKSVPEAKNKTQSFYLSNP